MFLFLAVARCFENDTWLLLLYALPTKRTSARVNLWRQLKKFGAVQLKTSAYVLPDNPTQHERFQWLSEEIRTAGGDASLLRVTEIEGMDSVFSFANRRVQ